MYFPGLSGSASQAHVDCAELAAVLQRQGEHLSAKSPEDSSEPDFLLPLLLLPLPLLEQMECSNQLENMMINMIIKMAINQS